MTELSDAKDSGKTGVIMVSSPANAASQNNDSRDTTDTIGSISQPVTSDVVSAPRASSTSQQDSSVRLKPNWSRSSKGRQRGSIGSRGSTDSLSGIDRRGSAEYPSGPMPRRVSISSITDRLIRRASAAFSGRENSCRSLDCAPPRAGFWTQLATDDAAWKDIDDNNELIDKNFSFRYSQLQLSVKEGWNIFVSHPYIGFSTLICLVALLAISIKTTVTFSNEYTAIKIIKVRDVALETGAWFRDQLDKATFPLFALDQFVKEMSIFQDLPFLIGQGGELGSAPYRNDTIVTHRYVSGICDNPSKIAAFNRIAKSIKDDANMEGVLVGLSLLPASVNCLIYPLNNTEDFTPPLYLDNSGAFGQDLLKNPKQREIALMTLPSHSIVVAGPLTLTQCPDCPPAVKVAFIAQMAVNMPPELGYNITVDGTYYSSYGFVSAIINWERLLEQSEIFERFRSLGIQFELSKTDRNFNTTTNQYDSKISVLAKSARANSIGANQFVNFSLPTTNNNWTIGVAYDDGLQAPWFPIVLAVSIILPIVLSIMLLFFLIEKQQRKTLLREIIPANAIKRLLNGQDVADMFNIVTLFQSDIIGYTAMAAGMTPIMIMQMLNSFYGGVDKLADIHRVYKIQTVGDAYICAAGCPEVCYGPDGAERIARFALDMMEFTKNFRTDEGAEISIRAGIHSGPLVAGIVGQLRPQYTVFGDTVAVASSMESTSKKMKIQCSDLTWRLLQDSPNCVFRFADGDKITDGRHNGKTWFIESAALCTMHTPRSKFFFRLGTLTKGII